MAVFALCSCCGLLPQQGGFLSPGPWHSARKGKMTLLGCGEAAGRVQDPGQSRAARLGSARGGAGQGGTGRGDPARRRGSSRPRWWLLAGSFF